MLGSQRGRKQSLQLKPARPLCEGGTGRAATRIEPMYRVVIAEEIPGRDRQREMTEINGERGVLLPQPRVLLGTAALLNLWKGP
mmetsp:Transcript_29465/g.67878  ORF Transcript_29465/g.67878 Transcript_29465/m.67878 type:complete len:84 (-) Transcript_29465:954-1205(-)